MSDLKKQRKKMLAEELWLNYFNSILFEKGPITESERNRMTILIADRSSGKDRQRRKPNALHSKRDDIER